MKTSCVLALAAVLFSASAFAGKPSKGPTASAGSPVQKARFSFAGLLHKAGQRGQKNHIWISRRTDGRPGTGTKEDPYDATSDLYSIWPTKVIAANPAIVEFENRSGAVVYTTSHHIQTPSGCEYRFNGATLKAAHNYWGNDDTGGGAHHELLSGEQGLIGETNLTEFYGAGADAVKDVTIKDIVVNCNNDGQDAFGNQRVNAIWLRGAHNKILNAHVIHFGNKDAQTDAECFPITIGNDGEVEKARFSDQDTINHGSMSLVTLANGHAAVDTPVYRVKVHGCRFESISTPIGHTLACINVGPANRCDIYGNFFHDLLRAHPIYDDTGSTVGTKVRDNIINNIYRSPLVGGVGPTGIYFVQAGKRTNTGLEICNNTITIGNEACGITLYHATKAADGQFGCHIRGNHVSLAEGTTPSFEVGIAVSNMSGGDVFGNIIGPSMATGWSIRIDYCDGVPISRNTLPERPNVTHSTSTDDFFNNDLSGRSLNPAGDRKYVH